MVKLFYSHFGRKRYFTISRRYILQQRMIHLVFKRRTKCYNSKTYRYCNTVFSTMESTCWQGRGPMSIGDPLTVTRGGGRGFIKTGFAIYYKLLKRPTQVNLIWSQRRKIPDEGSSWAFILLSLPRWRSEGWPDSLFSFFFRWGCFLASRLDSFVSANFNFNSSSFFSRLTSSRFFFNTSTMVKSFRFSFRALLGASPLWCPDFFSGSANLVFRFSMVVNA